MKVTFDVETTTKNKGNPFTKSNKLVSYSVKLDVEQPKANYFDEIEFTAPLKDALATATFIVGFNIKFDLHWAARHGIRLQDRCRVWDCQLGEFILSGQTNPYPSLNESLDRFGLGNKDDRIAAYWDVGIDTTEIPKEELLKYNNRDVDLTYELYLKQWESMTAQQRQLCLVMGLDLLVLQEMEENGHKLDVEQCKKRGEETKAELESIDNELLAMAGTPHVNLGSGQQLSFFLYGGVLEVDLPERIETLVYKSGVKKGQEYEKTYWKKETFTFPGYFDPSPRNKYKLQYQGQDVYAAGDDVLQLLPAKTKTQKRVIELLLRKAELDKLYSGYYYSYPALIEEMEWEDDILHGQYNQCTTRTGRLSSNKPNLQNTSPVVDQLLIAREWK